MLLLPKFQGTIYRQYHVLPTTPHFRNFVIPKTNTNNSEKPFQTTRKRNFHSSTKKRDTSKYKDLKIDPTKYRNDSGKNTVQYYRKLEKSMEDTLNGIKTDNSKDKLKTIWPDVKSDIQRLKMRDPNFEEESKEVGRPYDDLNLNDDRDFSRALSYVSTEETFPKSMDDLEERFPISETLNIGRHVQVTAGGRVFSFSALVMLGTGRGTGGLGYARGNTVPEAIAEAKKKAEKNLISLDLWRGYHIGADIRMKCKKSYVFMNAHPPGYGRPRHAWDMDIILDAFGLNDITIGWGGSKNKHTIYKAIFDGLKLKTRSPEKVARMLGMKLFNRAGAFYNTYD